MALSLPNATTPTPTAKRVVYLPDHLFFIRIVAVDETAEDVAAQIELALEGVSPFPINQLYYGYYQPSGTQRALVYAAYRRRFTAEQTALWPAADSVVPAFAALLPLAPSEPIAITLASETGVTLLWWSGTDPLPNVAAKFLPPDADEELKNETRTGLLGQAGLPAAAEISEGAAIFREEGAWKVEYGAFNLTLSEAQLDALDVRDKGDMAARLEDRKRSNLLWRIFMGCLAGLALCLVGELALVGTKLWQTSRVARLDRQRPVVEKISMSSDLASRIEEISTRKLLPVTMADFVNSKRPATVQFKRLETNGRTGIEVIAQTSNAGDFPIYVQALRDSPFCERVDTHDADFKSVNNGATFHLTVFFKPEALKGGRS